MMSWAAQTHQAGHMWPVDGMFYIDLWFKPCYLKLDLNRSFDKSFKGNCQKNFVINIFDIGFWKILCFKTKV